MNKKLYFKTEDEMEKAIKENMAYQVGQENGNIAWFDSMGNEYILNETSNK